MCTLYKHYNHNKKRNFIMLSIIFAIIEYEQHMYSKEDLENISYFKDVEITQLLDSLTGTLSRKYIVELGQHLIEENSPFTMALMDIDNFKFVNDNYGHAVGDECLVSVGTALINCIGNKGVVGRYGGDEFIIIYFGEHTYEEAHKFAYSIYGANKAIRRTHVLNNVRLFITGTVGNASFPKDANNYDELFSMVDKALYRGKSKGRNCYITYVKEKHEKIDVHKKETTSTYAVLKTLSDISRLNEKREVIIKYILNDITSVLGISQSLFVKTDGYTISSASANEYRTLDIYNQLIDKYLENEKLYIAGNMTTFKKSADKQIKDWVNEERILTFLMDKVKRPDEMIGSIILIEKNVQRIWQDRDKAIILYVNLLIENLYLQEK